MGVFLSKLEDILGMDLQLNKTMFLSAFAFIAFAKLTRWTIKTYQTNEFNPEIKFTDPERK